MLSIAPGCNARFVVFGAVYLLGALAWLRVDAGSPMRQLNSQGSGARLG